MKTREQNRNNKRTKIERFDWFIERIQRCVAFGWLSERSRKKHHVRELSRNQWLLRFDVILQHYWPIEQCLLHIRVFFGGKTKSPCFDLFIHWLMKQTTNTYRNHFSRSYENRSTITLIKLHCNERFRKHFNSFRSTMKHHHQKQITKNFPLQQDGNRKKKCRFTNEGWRMVKSETRRDAEILVRNPSPRLFGKKFRDSKKVNTNHAKTRLRDLSKTLPRFRDPAKIFRDPSFSRYHSPPF